jgi:CheY-specific phosphatase CheX
MGVKFFGQYLLENNVISSDQLMEAVNYQESINMDFGECALLKGYISEEDLVELKRKQREVDMRFGEIAIKLNILSPDQVMEILRTQKNTHIYIGEALVQKKFLTPDVIEKELALFKEDQSKYNTEEIMTPDEVRNPEVIKDVVGLTQKILYRVGRMVFKIDEGYISDMEPEKNFLMIQISLHGSFKCEYVLSLPEDISGLITSSIIGEDVNEPADIVIDGVKEFCNIVCGNIIAALSLKGHRVDISAPLEVACSDDGYNLVKGRKAIFYPLVSIKGNADLILIEGG